MKNKETIQFIIAVIVCLVLFGYFMYPQWQAQLAENRALQFQMQAQLVQAQALAGSANTIAAQSWLWPFLFAALGVGLVVGLPKLQQQYRQPPQHIIERERVVIVLPSNSQEARRLVDNLRRGYEVDMKKYEVLEVGLF